MIKLEPFAFSRCTGLQNVTLPSSLKEIGEKAFWDCGSLTEMTIPDSVKTIGGEVFLECSEKFTLCGTEGSEAQKYAGENGIKFTAKQTGTETDDVLYGDINADGVIDVTDISELSVALVDYIELEAGTARRADVTRDGIVAINDLAVIRQYLSKKIDKL